jgi:para-nitrobenzyl esterase
VEPIVATAQGKIRGQEQDGYVRFRGLPFARAERFAPPQPVEPWDDVRDALEFGPICPQNPSQLEQVMGARDANPQDEDCLSLNVWTPDLSGAHPVMVWIHGGAFVQGSGRVPWYDGRNFARDGIVLVTINYRLGPLGFLNLPGVPGSANAGILDQIAALRWVRENIANFGGDPDNVTIFGESAGGMSVGTLLGASDAAGLFQKAIPQSGASSMAMPSDVASRIAARVASEAGVGAGDVEALRALPVEKLLEATLTVQNLGATNPKELFGADYTGATMAFQPVVDGVVLDGVPIESVRAGSAKKVATLVGTTKDEWNLFTAFLPDDGGSLRRVPLPLRNLLERAGRTPDEFLKAYEHTMHAPSELDLRNAIETDRTFRIPAIRLAEAQSAQLAPTFMYLFAWPSTAFGGKLRACHALEIPFAFDNLNAPGADVFTGGSPPQELASDAHAAWVAFAKTGDPSNERTGEWPAYTTSRRATMVLDTPCHVTDDPGAGTRLIWEGLF